MADLLKCPKCAADLPPNAPGGICPKCLLQAGMDSESVSRTMDAGQTSAFQPPGPEELAAQFPDLEILELIGRGGMGAVYKARQRDLDRLVAVKILPPEVGADAAFAQRFSREARALARLGHQHIVSVYDFGRADDLYYIMMEYVDGTNLRRLIESRELTPAEALAIVPQICEALQFAHDEGIVHRDIKPENILITRRGKVKIADFGLAKLVGQSPIEEHLTATHQIMGTPYYMAPEQMQRTRTVDHRADIYSLGVVFYEMLTGDLPLGRFAPPSEKSGVSTQLDQVVMRTLAKEPNERYQRVGEVKTDVELVSASRLQAEPPSIDPPADLGVDAVATLSAPVCIRKSGARAGAGVLRLEERQLVLEFEADELAVQSYQHLFPGLAKGVTRVAVSLSDTASLSLVTGWRWNQLVLQTHSLQAVAEIPTSQQGRAVFAVARRDAAAAEQLVTAFERRARPSSIDLAAEVSDELPRSQPTAVAPAGSEVTSSAAARLVRGPSMGLIVAGTINCLAILPWMLLAWWGRRGWGRPFGGSDELVMIVLFVSALLGVPILLGAVKMRQREGYGISITGALLAMVPVTPGAIIGLPCGIWALAVLTERNVREAFRAHQEGRPEPHPKPPNLEVATIQEQLRLPAAALLISGAINALCLALWHAVGLFAMLTGLRLFGQNAEIMMVWLFCSAMLSVPVLFAAFKMQQLQAYRSTALGTLCAMLPITPGAVVGLPAGLWALTRLTGRRTAAAFRAVQATPLPAKHQADPAAIRFSRKAIIGACWAPLILFLVFSMTTLTPAVHEPQGGPRILERDSLDAPFTVVASERPRSVATGPTWWQWLMLLTVVPLSMAAPFGTTILGCLAISDIQHSQGRIVGLPLAVFDTLLFPLLALDALLLALLTAICVFLSAMIWDASVSRLVLMLIVVLVGVVICMILDFVIVRAVWLRLTRNVAAPV